MAAGLVLLGSQAAVAEQVTLKLSNGDTLHGTVIPSESTDTTTVLQHPVLGRLSIPKTALMPEPKPRPWKLSLSGGVSGSNTDNDLSAGGTLQIDSSYTEGADKVVFKGRAQYEVSRDQGESSKTTDTNEGDGELRYIRSLNSRLNAYAAANFNYDTLNTTGTDLFVSSIGIGYDLIKNKKTTVHSVTRSVDPADLGRKWLQRGSDLRPDIRRIHGQGGTGMETQFSGKPDTHQYLHGGIHQRNLDQQHFFDRTEGLSHEQSAPVHIAEWSDDLQRAAQSEGQQQHLNAGWREAGLISRASKARWHGIRDPWQGPQTLHAGSPADRDSGPRSATSGASGPCAPDQL